MHHKNIKLIIRKQLKKDCPHWRKLSKKEKKALVKQIAEAVVNDYDFNQDVEDIEAPVEELTGIENQIPNDDIIPLEYMEKLIDDFQNASLIDANEIKRFHVHIKDDALKFINNMLDNRIINHLLSYEGFTPEMRKFLPSHFLRTELLKALKYPEISYRKFCSKEYMGPDRKENREFIGLPPYSRRMIDHTQLSKFRASVTFAQSVNLLVYIICHFRGSGILKGGVLHAVDSTELFNDNWRPLFSTEINGKKIRVYEDLDCDCGKRRNKRNKSRYFVGYRMHTLTVVDAETGHAFPLASLVAAGNHHDSLLLKPLIQLAQAMGIELKLVTADEAYHDNDQSLYEETGVSLIKPPAAKTGLPDNTDSETLEVTLDDMCEIAMIRLGQTEEGHEYKCGAAPGECLRAEVCPQCRVIPFDNGAFQRIVVDNEMAGKAIDIRKNSERPFNLLKHREGLENIRVRSQRSLITQCAVATMATLLIEMERRREDRDDLQLRFDMAS
jgi:hypothetical protein